MNNQKILLSVVLPVYNGEKYLQEAIDSILAQTYKYFEFIILNDGSTDRTEEIILSYADDRIRYVKNERNLQIVATLNKGIDLVQGEYIVRMDADDISHPERFKKQLSFMESHLDIDVCGSHVKPFGQGQGHFWMYPTSPEALKVELLFCSPLAHPSVIIRKSFFEHNKYSEAYQKAEDYYLWASNKLNHSYANIPEVLLFYRIHDQQTATTHNDSQLELSNRIRYDLLSQFGLKATEEELKTHVKISRFEKIDLEKTRHWLVKVYEQNQVNVIYDNEALKKYLDLKWWEALHRSTASGLRIYWFYLKTSELKFSPKSFNAKLKFFIKCLIRHGK